MQKHYLILGGSSGIGLEIAKKLANENNTVILVGSTIKKLQSAREELLKETSFPDILEGRISIFQYDLNNTKDIEYIFEFCKEKGVKLDGMVYCAGVSPLCLLQDNTFELMQHVYNINLFSMIECCRCFYKTVYSNDGSKIVLISSVTAHASGYRQLLYGSSKAAMLAAARLMARELYNRKILINCISPGVTETPLVAELRQKSENLDEKILINQPLGIINPKKIAEFANFLLTDAAQFTTGNEFLYDSGFMLR